MLKNTISERPRVPDELRIKIEVNRDGVALYCNAAGLKAIAAELNWLAENPAEDYFHCHVRMHLGGVNNDVNKVRLVIDERVRPLFEQLPEDAEPDAKPCGFEVTFMHVTDNDAK